MPADAIVRVFTAQVMREEWAALQPLLAGHVVRYATAWRTVFAHWIGTSGTASGVDIVVVTGFENAAVLEAMAASLGAAQSRQGLMGEVVARGHVDDYELVDQLASSFQPGAASILRLSKVTLPEEVVGEVLARVDLARDALFASGDLAVAQTLRRDGPDGTHLLLLSLWRDLDALTRAQAADSAAGALRADLLREAARGWTYELQPISALRLAPDGPAILVTDDTGMVVDATPAAVAMLGRDVWRVLGGKLDDFGIAGAERIRLRRPEGGKLLIHARSLRDQPAPGRHATLLVPGSAPPPTDADAAAAVRLAYRWHRPADLREGTVASPS